jgi:peptidoglycan/xylan/chitin deacetylase (PgdA/CDA1 family)
MNRRDFVKLTTLASLTPMLASTESEKKPSSTEVYLTVDDGWHYKRTILEIAEHYNVPLNMFIIGKVIEQDPALWINAMDRGHLLGSHTYSHHKFSKIDTQTAMDDFKLYRKNMVNRIGKENFERIKYFRYPYGDTGNKDNKEDIKQLIEDNGWKISWWDMDLSFRSSSYGVMPYRDPRDQLKTFEHNINKSKNVLLFHFKAPDFQAIELVIKQGLDQGYKFGKLSDRNKLKNLIVS